MTNKAEGKKDVFRAVVDSQDGAALEQVCKVAARIIEVEKGEDDKVGSSQAITESKWQELAGEDRVLLHPFDPLALAELVEYNTELNPSVEAMEVNVSGFGFMFKPRVPLQLLNEKAREEALKELDFLTFWFDSVNPRWSFTKLRRMNRRDLELTGSSYLETIWNWIKDQPSGFQHIQSHTMAITKTDQDPTETKFYRYRFDRQKKDIIKEDFNMFVHFRQFIQKRDEKAVWFRELGDPRIIDAKTGKVATKDLPAEQRANSILYNFIYSARSSYGIPRWIGVLLSISGSRKAQEINFSTLESNNIPSMVISVSGGVLTEGSVDRIQEFVRKIGIKKNWTRFLLLEAEKAEEGGFGDTGAIKIDVQPLTNDQIKDALFQEYEESVADRVRRSWRLPPIFVGRSDDYTRATAESSRRLADEQVFDPERREEDETINKLILPILGAKYYKFQSKTPNVTDDAQLIKLLVAAEKAGGMTPGIAREMISDVMGRDLGTVEGIPEDIPFTIQVAERAKNTGPINQGTVAASKGLSDSAYTLAEFLMQLRHDIQKQAVEEALEKLEETPEEKELLEDDIPEDGEEV